jgi:tetratricopeptide (TPR) repeat protein
MSFRRFQESAKARLGVQIALGVIAFIFVVGAFYSFGPVQGMGGFGRDRDAIIVNGQRIKSNQYYRALEMYRSQYGSPLTQEYALMYLATRDLVRQAVVSQAIDAAGIKAARDEVEERREEYIQDRLEMAGPEGPERQRFLYDQGMSWEEYQDEVYTSARGMTEQFESQIQMEKLESQVTENVTVSDDELLAQYRKFTFHQIFLKVPSETDIEQWEQQQEMLEELEAEEETDESEEAANDAEADEEATADEEPDAGGEDDGTTDDEADDTEATEEDDAADDPAWLERTEAEAIELAEELRSRIEAGDDMEELAEEYSDDGWLATMGGVWEEVGYSQLMGMPEEVRQVVIEGEEGDLSQPLITDRGVYLIRVDEVTEEEVPEDFEETKEAQREQRLDQKKATEFNEFVQNLVDTAVVEFEKSVPRAHIAWLINHGREDMTESEMEARRLEAIDRLNELIAEELKEAELAEAGGTEFLAKDYYQLGVLYQQGEQWAQALEAQQNALAANPLTEVKLEVARCLVELDRGEQAKPILEDVITRTPIETGMAVHSDVARMYRQIGEDDLAAAVETRVMEAQQSAGFGGGGMPPGAMMPGGFSR